MKQNYPLTSKRTGYPTLFHKAGRMQAESEQQDCEAGPFFDANFKAYWLSYCILFGELANKNSHYKNKPRSQSSISPLYPNHIHTMIPKTPTPFPKEITRM